MNEINPELLRGMTRSRRDALRLFGLAGAGLGLAACGVKGQKAAPAKQSDVQKYWNGKTKHGHVNFANWPLYMDKGRTPLKQFTKETGISVTYREVIQDDPSWFGKIQPQLQANQSIGYDLMVITNGVSFTKLTELGYLVPLDHSKMPNFAKNAGAAYKNESFDPGNVYSVPYQTGITGIAYDPAKTGREITSLADLWDPKFKGKVGMFSDVQEIGNFGMMAVGVNPEQSTADDWKKAGAKLQEQKDQGIVRKYFDQDYIDALSRGDIWLSMAYSGDIFQQNLSEGSNLKFVIPEEGGTIWTDNLTIPKTAENPVDALTLLDYFYRPDVAAQLAEIVSYVTPVPGAKDVLAAEAAKATGSRKKTLQTLADSPLIFPSDADYARLRHYRKMTTAEEQQYNGVFQKITAG
ncbi:spermidine/putrescine ABC transporter substrate-binding protein [Actinoallomurus spadix]|uniref:Spermidine/putrescine ABC transporter substrate-binding protein n=1 Tax=Actinoallomurus spadix TaxID=79912 RepID=A0ABN0WQ58_9ACTN|nr:spermidine/putrescine ABC transporter substrate-binding protein [Actinoallomurus spadix]MCO5984871.1 spermidine/putrescine ABC transporter substrate-binding protein [Actinoallomurus spadix]